MIKINRQNQFVRLYLWLSCMVLFLQFVFCDVGFTQTEDLLKAQKRIMTSDLILLHRSFTAYTKSASIQTFQPKNRFLSINNAYVVIDAVASLDTRTLLSELEDLGLKNGTRFGRSVSGQLPIVAVDKLINVRGLKFVRPAYVKTNVGLVDSQADAAMRSDITRALFGIDGSGVLIGTLSDSYDNLEGAADDVASGDLPTGIIVLEDLESGGSDEGRAMMQLIHDVAPGAAQAFRTAFIGEADFAQGILDLADAGADVIVDDIIYFAEPMFQDGIIAQAVDEVVGNGVAYFSSAGNGARESYESPFTPDSTFDAGTFPTDVDFDSLAPVFAGGTAHDFGNDDIFQNFSVLEGSELLIVLQWDEPFFSVSGGSGTTNEVDIYILNEPPTMVVGGSSFSNFGNDAVEIFDFNNPEGSGQTEFNIMIVHNTNVSGAAPGHIKYVRFEDGDITINEFDTRSSTIYGHANAAGAEAVGAADYRDTPEFGTDPPVLEDFSSAGPTAILFGTDGVRLLPPEVRMKPEIVAPDGTNNTFFGSDVEPDGFPNFFGTSAAAPHAAAVAALLLEADNSLIPSSIYSTLESTAIDMNEAGFDFESGYGLIQAFEAVNSIAGPPPLAFVGDFVWQDNNSNGIQDPGEPGIKDVPVKLSEAGGNIVDSTQTDSLGNYSFVGITPGDYFLTFELVSDFDFSTKDATDDNMDSDVDPTTGETDVFTLNAGSIDKSRDAGMIFTTTSVGDFVWRDDNGDGIHDSKEPGLDGVTVKLFDSVGFLIDTTITMFDGFYDFTSLSAGDYFLKFTLLPGFSFSPKDATGDNEDSDVDQTTGETDIFTLVIGPQDSTWDAGLVPPPPAAADPGISYATTGFKDGGNLLTINLTTGLGTLVGATGLEGVPGLAINSKGEIFATKGESGDLYRIDAATGEARFQANTGLEYLDGIAFDETDTLYGVDLERDLYRIDTVTGDTSNIGRVGENITGLSFNPTNGTLWGSAGGTGSDAEDGIYTIDKTTGEATLIGTTGLGGATPDLHFDAAGNLFGSKNPEGGFSGNPSNLVLINKSTGEGIVIGSVGFSSVSGLATFVQLSSGAKAFVIPRNIDFGNQQLGQIGKIQQIVISNIGDTDLTISSISNPGPPFILANLPSLSIFLEPAGSSTFGVFFSPENVGEASGSFTITSSDTVDSTIDITLTGSGFGLNPAGINVCYATTGFADGGNLITINPVTGAGTLVGPTGLEGVPGLAINSNVEIFATARGSGKLYRLDAVTGGAILVDQTGLNNLDGIAFGENDVLYGVDEDTGLYMIDTDNGDTTFVGFTDAVMTGLAFEPGTGILWGSSSEDGIYTIDVSSGVSTFIGVTGFGGSIPDIFFDENGNLFGTKGGGQRENMLISINKVTGAGTGIGPIGFLSVSGLAYRVGTTDVAGQDGNIPTSFALHQNFPNPFNPETRIQFDLPKPAMVKLEIFNILGKKIRTLINERHPAGSYSVTWDGRNDIGKQAASGVYIFTIDTVEFKQNRKMLLLK